MILSASQLLAEHFPAGLVYRIGGDEFLAVCFDGSRESFQEQVDRLLEQLQKTTPIWRWAPSGLRKGVPGSKSWPGRRRTRCTTTSSNTISAGSSRRMRPVPVRAAPEQSSRTGTPRRPSRHSSTTIITTPRRFPVGGHPRGALLPVFRRSSEQPVLYLRQYAGRFRFPQQCGLRSH